MSQRRKFEIRNSKSETNSKSQTNKTAFAGIIIATLFLLIVNFLFQITPSQVSAQTAPGCSCGCVGTVGTCTPRGCGTTSCGGGGGAPGGVGIPDLTGLIGSILPGAGGAGGAGGIGACLGLLTSGGGDPTGCISGITGLISGIGGGGGTATPSASSPGTPAPGGGDLLGMLGPLLDGVLKSLKPGPACLKRPDCLNKAKPDCLIFNDPTSVIYCPADLTASGSAAASPSGTLTPATPSATLTTPTSSVCPGKIRGDADCSGNITLADFSIWAKQATATDSAGTEADFGGPDGDGVFDGVVDMTDYEIWRSGFYNETPILATLNVTPTPTSSAPVPTGSPDCFLGIICPRPSPVVPTPTSPPAETVIFAKNPVGGECRKFSTDSEIPAGWVKGVCTISGPTSTPVPTSAPVKGAECMWCGFTCQKTTEKCYSVIDLGIPSALKCTKGGLLGGDNCGIGL